MDLLTTQDLRIIAEREDPVPSVSLFMPTHRSGNDTAGDRVRWKNLVGATAGALADRGVAEETSTTCWRRPRRCSTTR